MYKKILFLFLVLMPLNVNASTYEAKDLSINLDDNEWIVVTKDNVDNITGLEELGLSSSHVKSVMSQDSLYIDAMKKENDGSFFELRVLTAELEGNTKLKHLHEFSEEDLSGYAEGIKYTLGISSYEVFTTTNGYKYVYVQYINNGNHVEAYFTVINYDTYIISTSHSDEFTPAEKEHIKSIVGSVEFDGVKPNETEDIKPLNPFITGAIVAACLAALGAIFGRNAKQNKKKNK